MFVIYIVRKIKFKKKNEIKVNNFFHSNIHGIFMTCSAHLSLFAFEKKQKPKCKHEWIFLCMFLVTFFQLFSFSNIQLNENHSIFEKKENKNKISNEKFMSEMFMTPILSPNGCLWFAYLNSNSNSNVQRER